ncbi:hypothetical protein RCL1_007341 [Eukaryota sp. TZLM3-RCL]
MIFGRSYYIIDADPFTRTFYQSNLIDLAPRCKDVPVDVFSQYRRQVEDVGTYTIAPKLEELPLRKFLANDNKVLRYYAYWNDNGDHRHFECRYYLADDFFTKRSSFLVTIFLSSLYKLLRNQFAFLNAIFPVSITNQRGHQVNVTELLPAVNSSPRSFLNASLILSREIESLGGTPFNVLPLTTKNVPGFFTLDTRLLNLLISEVVEEQDEIDDEEAHQNELNVNKQVNKFSPEEQTNYWGQFIDLTTKPFKKKFHHFNNIIHTDGMNLTIQFCRVDERGKPCIGKSDTGELKDNEFYFTAEHNSLIDEGKVVTCDPGKRDWLYFCSKKPHQPIFVEEEENETKKIKDYEWLRLTYPEWTRVSRVHQKELLQCRQAFGIEEIESTLSQYRSNAASFNDFRNYVLEKTRGTETNDWFYQLDLWRIHKMQNLSHRQKVESKLKTSLIEKYATRAANGRVLKKPVIMIGDFSKQGGCSINLKHNPPFRGSGWRKTLRKLGFPVFLLNEWGTSSRCPECGQEVKKFLQVPNPKPYRREKTPTTLCHGLLECTSDTCKNGGERKYWNRNGLACTVSIC